MSSRYNRKASSNTTKKKSPSGVIICLKLNFGVNGNERIQIARRTDTRRTTLSQIIEMAIDTSEDQSTKLLLQSILNNTSTSSVASSIIYMRTSIPRQSWDDTTLAAMGIDNASGGSVLLTLNAKVGGNEILNSSAPSSATATTAATEPTANDDNAVTSMDTSNIEEIQHATPKEETKSASQVVGMDVDTATPTTAQEPMSSDSNPSDVPHQQQQQQPRPQPPPPSNEPPPKPSLQEALQAILNNNFDASSKECLLTLLKMLNNLLSTTSKEPKGEKFRTINLQNAALQKKVLSNTGSLEFFIALGFQPKAEPGPTIGMATTSSSHIVLLPTQEDRSLIEKAASSIRLLLVSELGMHGDELPKPPSPPPISLPVRQNAAAAAPGATATFDIYKGHAFNVTAAAVGADGTGVVPEKGAVSRIDSELKRLEAKAAAIQNKSKRENFDRELVALKPGQQQPQQQQQASASAAGSGSGSRGGTSDGALLAGRMKRMEEERQKRENGGLTTKAMRDLEKLKQTKVYQFTQIRICFPDGYSINGKFHPTETIQHIKDVVVESIISESLPKQPEFNLYVAPPPKVLDVTSTLSKESLVPAARVHVSWKNDSAPSKGTDYIKPELFNNEATSATSFPQGKALVDDNKTTKKKAAAGDDSSKKKNNAMDEDALMERMLGKKSSLLKKGTGGSGSGSGGKPKWFKG